MLEADGFIESGFSLAQTGPPGWGPIVVLLPLLLFALYAVYWIWFRSGKK